MNEGRHAVEYYAVVLKDKNALDADMEAFLRHIEKKKMM